VQWLIGKTTTSLWWINPWHN